MNVNKLGSINTKSYYCNATVNILAWCTWW